MISKKPGPNGKVQVTFALPSSFWADTIHLVGDFNDWDPSATPLHLGDSTWNVSLELEPGRSYKYRYLINQCEWVTDWQADSFVPDEAGGSSVIITLLAHQAHGNDEYVHERQSPPHLRLIQGGQGSQNDKQQAV